MQSTILLSYNFLTDPVTNIYDILSYDFFKTLRPEILTSVINNVVKLDN